MTHLIPKVGVDGEVERADWQQVKNKPVIINNSDDVSVGLWHDGVNPVGYDKYGLTILTDNDVDQALAKEWLKKAVLRQMWQESQSKTVSIMGVPVLNSVFDRSIGLYVSNIMIEYKLI